MTEPVADGQRGGETTGGGDALTGLYFVRDSPRDALFVGRFAAALGGGYYLVELTPAVVAAQLLLGQRMIGKVGEELEAEADGPSTWCIASLEEIARDRWRIFTDGGQAMRCAFLENMRRRGRFARLKRAASTGEQG